MESDEKFCLKWNDFETNISTAFRELRDSEPDLLDCTLATADKEQLRCHKLILSACSPWFRSVFRSNPHPKPLLWLKGVSGSHMQSVLQFMYEGSVNIAQEDLDGFLSLAQELQIKGLTQNEAAEREVSRKPKPRERPPDPVPPPAAPPPQKRMRPVAARQGERSRAEEVGQYQGAQQQQQQLVTVKREPGTGGAVALQDGALAVPAEEENYEEYYDESYAGAGEYGEYEGEANSSYGAGETAGSDNKGKRVDQLLFWFSSNKKNIITIFRRKSKNSARQIYKENC